MIDLYINGDVYLDLLILHGDKAVDLAFDALKEEFYRQVDRLKQTGEYEEYKKALHQSILEKVKNQSDVA